MTFEEAHKHLENLQREFTRHRQAYSNVLITANGKAILALEKQIPKKPKYKSENSLPSCSQCGGIIDLLQGDANYCPNCGQKLDWTDT